MILGYRSNDAVITICQNNLNKTIKISELSSAAEELLGYRSSELVGQPLSMLLPPRIAELLTEYVEFEPDANDVGGVLSKVQSFSVLTKAAKETVFRMKLVRAQSSSNVLYFALVLHDTLGIRKNDALRRAIQENFKGHEVIDELTGLPDKESQIKNIAVMAHYCHSGEVLSCFGIMQVDGYDKFLATYGQKEAEELLKHIAAISGKTLRPDDVVGYINHKRIGVLLVDTQPESARMVFNRLRWQIAANPYMASDGTAVGVSVSASFARIGGEISDKEIYSECEQALGLLSPDAINVMVDVTSP
jgi:diguanylate cyclase (GGDEF)-like protein